EEADVLGDALVRVVGGVAEQLHAVVIRRAEPAAEKAPGHPGAPSDLEPLREIELINLEHDRGTGEHGEDGQLAGEGVPVAILQRVVETRVPPVYQHVDADVGEHQGDDGGEQSAPDPFLLGIEIWGGEPADDGERCEKTGHGRLPCRWRGRSWRLAR